MKVCMVGDVKHDVIRDRGRKLSKRQLKGVNRQQLVNDVLLTGTELKSHYCSKMSTMNDTEIRHDNVTAGQSPQATRQAVHVYKLKEPLCDNMFQEICGVKKKSVKLQCNWLVSYSLFGTPHLRDSVLSKAVNLTHFAMCQK